MARSLGRRAADNGKLEGVKPDPVIFSKFLSFSK